MQLTYVKRMIALFAISSGWLAIAAGWSGCSSNDITSPEQIVFPTSNVSYRLHVAPYLQISCNFTGCHDGSSQQTSVNLTSWVMVRDQVRSGDTLTSPLVSVTSGRENHYGGQIICNVNQRQGIARWVLDSAKDN